MVSVSLHRLDLGGYLSCSHQRSDPGFKNWCRNHVSVDTVRVLDLAGDSGLGDGGRCVPQQEALAKHKVWGAASAEV